MVKLENTSDAAIYLPRLQAECEVDGKKKTPFDNDTINVPRAKRLETTDEKTGEKRTKVELGTAEVDDEVWARLKKNKVVLSYLSSGRLRVVGSSGPPPEPVTSAGGKGGR
jgi:hypothetical protein